MMGKYKYLNAAEVQSEIEKFGTDDEREILGKICAEPNWDDCPHCDEFQRSADSAWEESGDMQDAIDDIANLLKDDEVSDTYKLTRIAEIVS